MTEITLRSGATTLDPRLDALFEKDEKSRAHPITALLPSTEHTSRVWRLQRSKQGDQGHEGACVEFGISHVLAALPLSVALKVLRLIRGEHRIYWPAQRDFDEWEGGSYPGGAPVYEGTSLLAGCKATQALGLISAYSWAFSIDELLAGLAHHGPAAIAVSWTENMSSARPDGLITGGGNVRGGHCVAVIGVEFGRKFQDGKRDVAVIAQSWGPDYGDHGRVYYPLADLEASLSDGGETAFLTA
jgi:hypothetical protein